MLSSQVRKTKILSDEEWAASLGHEDRSYFRANQKSTEYLEETKVLCTSCQKQVNHKDKVKGRSTILKLKQRFFIKVIHFRTRKFDLPIR